MIEARPQGLYSPHGDFYIDPSEPVERAVVTHGHADHASGGHGVVLCSHDTARILALRLPQQSVTAFAYGETVMPGVTLHPAGHILGSAQVRIEAEDVTVVSGDYKRHADPTCAPFEVIPCDTFVSEATFALPTER